MTIARFECINNSGRMSGAWTPWFTHGESRLSASRKGSAVKQTIFWHRELPPVDAELLGEHTLEATSAHVEGTLAHRDEIWDTCHRDLMAQTSARLSQEISRLGGRFAHVLDESIDPRHDEVKGEAWLHGRFKYVLYR
jgi:hypothetical protein